MSVYKVTVLIVIVSCICIDMIAPYPFRSYPDPDSVYLDDRSREVLALARLLKAAHRITDNAIVVDKRKTGANDGILRFPVLDWKQDKPRG